MANNGSCLLNAQIQLNDVVGILTFFKSKVTCENLIKR